MLLTSAAAAAASEYNSSNLGHVFFSFCVRFLDYQYPDRARNWCTCWCRLPVRGKGKKSCGSIYCSSKKFLKTLKLGVGELIAWFLSCQHTSLCRKLPSADCRKAPTVDVFQLGFLGGRS